MTNREFAARELEKVAEAAKDIARGYEIKGMSGIATGCIHLHSTLLYRAAELRAEDKCELEAHTFTVTNYCDAHKKIGRNMSTAESRAYWETVEQSSREVSQWPAWKRAGVNASQVRDEPRPSCANAPCSCECHAEGGE
jgi:hypothetical protein